MEAFQSQQTQSYGKLRFNPDPDTFPFENLAIGNRQKGMIPSPYGDVHVSTYIKNGNALEDYEITWPYMTDTSITYYIDKDGNNLKDPKFYLHPNVHAVWGEKDKEGNYIKTDAGSVLEEFQQKFIAALIREINKLSPQDKIWMMGNKKCNAVDPIEDFIKFSKYPDNHKTMAKMDNMEKSPSIAMALWSQDITKKKESDENKSNQNNKRKYANLHSTFKPNQQSQNQKKDDNLMVPDTNAIIYTKIFNIIKGKNGKVTDEQRKNKITDYGQLFKFVHNNQGHPNASETMGDLFIEIITLGPSIRFLPAKNLDGNIQFKVSELKIAGFNSHSKSKGLSDEALDKADKKAEEAMKALGFKQDESSSSSSDNDDNFENDSPPQSLNSQLQTIQQQQFEYQQQLLQEHNQKQQQKQQQQMTNSEPFEITHTQKKQRTDNTSPIDSGDEPNSF